MSISKKTIDDLELDPEVKAELQKLMIEVDSDSYLLTPAAMNILNDLNAQAIEDARNGLTTINVGKLGALNHNGRIYMNGEHITAGQVSKQLTADYEHPEAIPPESDVTHYSYDGRSLEGLTMKDEYKFESFQRAIEQNPDKILEIDSLGGVTGEVKGVHLSHKGKSVKVLVVDPGSRITRTDWAKVFEDVKLVPMEDLHAGMIYRGNPSGKTLIGVLGAVTTGGHSRFSDMEGWGRQFRLEEKEVTPTVRTNGRQKLVDNGKRQWPGPKQRKGHRKHG